MGDRRSANVVADLRATLKRFVPVTWRDENGVERNAWTRNLLTGEIEPDPEGDPLYTTALEDGHG